MGISGAIGTQMTAVVASTASLVTNSYNYQLSVH